MLLLLCVCVRGLDVCATLKLLSMDGRGTSEGDTGEADCGKSRRAGAAQRSRRRARTARPSQKTGAAVGGTNPPESRRLVPKAEQPAQAVADAREALREVRRVRRRLVVVEQPLVPHEHREHILARLRVLLWFVMVGWAFVVVWLWGARPRVTLG